MVTLARDYLELVAAVAGGIAALTYLARAGRKIAARLEALAHVVERELQPNGGSSIKDHITQNSHRLDVLETRLTAIEKRLTP